MNNMYSKKQRLMSIILLFVMIFGVLVEPAMVFAQSEVVNTGEIIEGDNKEDVESLIDRPTSDVSLDTLDKRVDMIETQLPKQSSESIAKIDGGNEDSIFTYKKEDGNIIITGLKEGVELENNTLIIPSKIGNTPVVKIDEHAFQKSAQEIKTLIFEGDKKDDNLTIGKYAFADNKIENILFNKRINNIEEYAFRDNQIEFLYLDETSITVINEGVFMNNKIRDIKFNEELRIISNYGFKQNRLTVLDLTKNIEEIGEEAFSYNRQVVELKNLNEKEININSKGYSKEEPTKYGYIVNKATIKLVHKDENGNTILNNIIIGEDLSDTKNLFNINDEITIGMGVDENNQKNYDINVTGIKGYEFTGINTENSDKFKEFTLKSNETVITLYYKNTNQLKHIELNADDFIYEDIDEDNTKIIGLKEEAYKKLESADVGSADFVTPEIWDEKKVIEIEWNNNLEDGQKKEDVEKVYSKIKSIDLRHIQSISLKNTSIYKDKFYSPFKIYETIGPDGKKTTGFYAPEVTKIGNYAFEKSKFQGEFNALKVTRIGDAAFENSQFTGSFNAQRITTIGDKAFYNSVFKQTADPGNNKTDGFFAPKVTKIGNNAFAKSQFTGNFIVNTVYTIGGNAFENSKFQGDFYTPEVTTIRYSAFVNSEFEGVFYAPKVTLIDNFAFQNSKFKGEFNAPQVTTIGNGAFSMSNFDGEFNAPQVEKIGEYAFASRNGYSGSKFTGSFHASKVEQIGQYAFAQSKFTGVFYAPNITSIGNAAFIYSEYKEVFVARNIETIGDKAFENSNFTGSFNAPKVKKIGSGAFMYSQFKGEFDTPQVTTIGQYAFQNSAFTGEFDAPQVTRIGEYAFQNSQFNGRFYVPKVERIDKYAFEKSRTQEIQAQNLFVIGEKSIGVERPDNVSARINEQWMPHIVPYYFNLNLWFGKVKVTLVDSDNNEVVLTEEKNNGPTHIITNKYLEEKDVSIQFKIEDEVIETTNYKTTKEGDQFISEIEGKIPSGLKYNSNISSTNTDIIVDVKGYNLNNNKISIDTTDEDVLKMIQNNNSIDDRYDYFVKVDNEKVTENIAYSIIKGAIKGKKISIDKELKEDYRNLEIKLPEGKTINSIINKDEIKNIDKIVEDTVKTLDNWYRLEIEKIDMEEKGNTIVVTPTLKHKNSFDKSTEGVEIQLYQPVDSHYYISDNMSGKLVFNTTGFQTKLNEPILKFIFSDSIDISKLSIPNELEELGIEYEENLDLNELDLKINSDIIGGMSFDMDFLDFIFRKFSSHMNIQGSIQAILIDNDSTNTENRQIIASSNITNYSGYYNQPSMNIYSAIKDKKQKSGDVFGGSRYFGEAEVIGEYIRVKEPSDLLFYFDTSGIYNKETVDRYVSESKHVVYLPTYKAINDKGEEVELIAHFDKSKNADWELSEDGKAVISYKKANKDTISVDYSDLLLSFPNIYVDTDNKIEIISDIELTPQKSEYNDRYTDIESKMYMKDTIKIYPEYKRDNSFIEKNGNVNGYSIIDYGKDYSNSVFEYNININNMYTEKNSYMSDIVVTDHTLDSRLKVNEIKIDFPIYSTSNNANELKENIVKVLLYKSSETYINPKSDNVVKTYEKVKDGDIITIDEGLEFDYFQVVFDKEYRLKHNSISDSFGQNSIKINIQTSLKDKNEQLKSYDKLCNNAVISTSIVDKNGNQLYKKGDKIKNNAFDKDYVGLTDELKNIDGNLLIPTKGCIDVWEKNNSVKVEKKQRFTYKDINGNETIKTKNEDTVPNGTYGTYFISLKKMDVYSFIENEYINLIVEDTLPDGLDLIDVRLTQKVKELALNPTIEVKGNNITFKADKMPTNISDILEIDVQINIQDKGTITNEVSAKWDNEKILKEGSKTKESSVDKISVEVLDTNVLLTNKKISRIKTNSEDEALGWTNHIVTNPNEEFLYKLEINNKTNNDIENLEIFDVLPFKGDENIQELNIDKNNRYSRESEFRNSFEEIVSIPNGYTVKYLNQKEDLIITGSVDKYLKEIPDEKWSDKSNNDTKAIKIVANEDILVEKGETLEVVYKMKAPENKDYLLTGKKAWNSFVRKFDSDNDLNRYLESNRVSNEMSGTDENGEASATIKLKKYGKDSPDSDIKPLANATFGLYDIDGILIKEGTSNKEGEISFENLEVGDYFIKEVKAPEGYYISKHIEYVSIDDFKQSENLEINLESKEFVNTKYNPKGKVSISKIAVKDDFDLSKITNIKDEDIVKTMVGYTFLITDTVTQEQFEFVSGIDKELDNIVYGRKYTIEEVLTPQNSDYMLNENVYTFILDNNNQLINEDGEEYSGNIVRIPNKKFTYENSLIINKLDEKENPLSGATFELKGVSVSSKGYIKELTTDKDGKIAFENLPQGSYELKEIKAPEGFLLDDRVTTLHFNGDKAEHNANKIIEKKTIERVNKKVEINVYKREFLFYASNDKAQEYINSKSNDEETYKMYGNEYVSGVYKMLEGVEFDIYEDNKKIATVETDNEGKLDLSEIQFKETSNYKIIESKPLDGYRLDNTPIFINIKSDIENNRKLEYNIHVNNKKGTGDLYISKYLTNNKEKLKDIEFEIYKKGTEDTEKPIETKKTDESGFINFSGLTLGESYIIKEVESDNYEVDDTIWEFTPTSETPSKLIVVYNNNKDVNIQLTKVDGNDENTKLEGAEFTLYTSEDGEQFEEVKLDNEVITAKSDKNGIVSFKNVDSQLLNKGLYIKETKAPKGYRISSEYKHIDIDEYVSKDNPNTLDLGEVANYKYLTVLPETGKMTMLYISNLILISYVFYNRKKDTKKY